MPIRKNSSKQLRLRVFAGPNGSGKSTIIKAVRGTIIGGKKVDFGYYINADDITQLLLQDKFSFSSFRLKPKAEHIITFAEGSGLLDTEFNLPVFTQSFSIKNSKLVLGDFAMRIESGRSLRDFFVRKCYGLSGDFLLKRSSLTSPIWI